MGGPPALGRLVPIAGQSCASTHHRARLRTRPTARPPASSRGTPSRAGTCSATESCCSRTPGRCFPTAPLSSLTAQQAGHPQMACCRTGHVRAGAPVPHGRAHEGAPRRTPVTAQSGAARPAGCPAPGPSPTPAGPRRRSPPGPEPGPSRPPARILPGLALLNHPPSCGYAQSPSPSPQITPKLSVPPPNLTN